MLLRRMKLPARSPLLHLNQPRLSAEEERRHGAVALSPAPTVLDCLTARHFSLNFEPTRDLTCLLRRSPCSVNPIMRSFSLSSSTFFRGPVLRPHRNSTRPSATTSDEETEAVTAAVRFCSWVHWSAPGKNEGLEMRPVVGELSRGSKRGSQGSEWGSLRCCTLEASLVLRLAPTTS